MTKTILTFAAGIAVGSIFGYMYAKNVYEEQISSMREHFSPNRPPIKKEESDVLELDEKQDDNDITVSETDVEGAEEYCGILNSEGYTVTETRKIENPRKPYVISPEQYEDEEYDDFEKITLSYYADQIIADDDDVIMENVDDVIGYDSLTHFGEYEDDCVLVRNERLKCDYEICLCKEKYTDILADRPYKEV